jgi:hypothetical protein
MAKTWRRLPAKTRLRRVDKQAIKVYKTYISTFLLVSSRQQKIVVAGQQTNNNHTFNSNKIVGVQSRNKCSLGNVERTPHPPHPPHTPHTPHTPHRKKFEFFIKNKNFHKVLKLKIYYAKWTLRIEVVNSKKNIYYCSFRVYLVTGPIEGR